MKGKYAINRVCAISDRMEMENAEKSITFYFTFFLIFERCIRIPGVYLLFNRMKT